jgi:hypothetical protein
VQQLPNAGIQKLPKSLGGGWGRGRAADGEAAAARGGRRGGRGGAQGRAQLGLGQLWSNLVKLDLEVILQEPLHRFHFCRPSKRVFAGNRCR